MARVIAVDFGTKRVGLAVTDPSQIIATPMDTVHAKDAPEFILNYCKKEEVEVIVVGEPKRMNNEPSDVEVHIQAFINRLNKILPNTKIERVDERFTSKMAFQAMLDGGMKKKDRKDKGTIDKISATIILQTYLDRIK
jgi:putative Holliday junction resolvase